MDTNKYVNADGYFHTHAYSFSHHRPYFTHPALGWTVRSPFISPCYENLTVKYLISFLIGLIPIQNSQQIRGYDYLKTYNPFKVFVAYTSCVIVKKCTLQIKHISKFFFNLKTLLLILSKHLHIFAFDQSITLTKFSKLGIT